MKRLVLSLCAAVYVLSFTACEPHKVADLPKHYQEHGAGGHHDDGHPPKAGAHKTGEPHKDPAPADPHAKPAEPEKKAH